MTQLLPFYDKNRGLDLIFLLLNIFLLNPFISEAQPTGATINNPIVMGIYWPGISTFVDTESNDPSNGFRNDMGQASEDIYYMFTIKSTATVTASHCGSSITDSYIYLLKMDGTIITYNDDNGPKCSGMLASISITLSAGTYFIVSEGYSTKYGNITTNVSLDVQMPQYASYNTMNFIRTWEAKAPGTDPNAVMSNSVRDVKQTTQYFDGIGKPIQTVVKQESIQTGNNPTDLVNIFEYDAIGREEKKYLPYSAPSNDGLYKQDPLQQQQVFFQQQFAQQGEASFFGQTVFDASPSNRIIKKMAPGNNWVGSNRGVQTNYEVNTAMDDVKMWKNNTPANNAYGLQVFVTNAGNGTQTVTYSWNSPIPNATAILLLYRISASSSWNSNAGSPISPRNYSMSVGTYEYAIQIYFSNGSQPQTVIYTPSIAAGYSTSEVYSSGKLFKTIVVDENLKQKIEFKDKDGKVILTKKQLTASSDDGSGSGYIGWICTYYIYDDFGNLRYLILPEGVKTLLANNWQLTENILNEQCFLYEYDQRNRRVIKKVPGAGEEYMVYDLKDRLVLFQDANMRAQGKWKYIQYDELNRPVSSGLWSNTDTRYTHTMLATKSTTYPSLSGQTYEELTRTYYDNYDWASSLNLSLKNFDIGYTSGSLLTASNTIFPYPQTVTYSLQTKGLVTGSKTKVMGTSTYLTTISYYDETGREIQVRAENVTGGIDVSTTQYNWTGQPLITIRKFQKAGTNAQEHIVVTKKSYDELGRLLNIKKSVSSTVNGVSISKPEQLIVSNTYNTLGQLKTKLLGANGLELQTYDYNVRGWLLGINRDYAKDANNNNYFGFDLGYEKSSNGIINNQTYSNPQFNGNIEGMVWKSKGDGEKRKYDYTYDASERIIRADFTQYTGGNFNKTANVDFSMLMGDGTNSNSAYDDNGNILRMQQWGLKITGSRQIDDMLFSYFNNGNKLKAVTEQGSGMQDYKLGDFTDKNTSSIDYGYDLNGNLLTDLNKGMKGITGVDLSTGGAIQYNILNLPQQITLYKDDGTIKGNIIYLYDAVGNKLKKTTTDNGVSPAIVTTTLYLSGAVYTNETLQFLDQEEGRIRFKPGINSIPGSFQYDYFLKDHLGNVRAVITEEQQTDKYPTATLESQQLAFEKNFYKISDAQIVDKSTVLRLPAYTNDNGIGNNPSNPSFEQTASTKLYKLNSSTNKTGLGITLKVMAGDKINILGKSYYDQYNTGGTGANIAVPVIELLTGLLGSPTGVVASAGIGDVTATQLNTIPTTTTGISSLLTLQTTENNINPQRPKAYINYMFFDEQLKYVAGGFSAVGYSNQLKDHFSELQNIPVNKNGYVYIYVSNESPINVYFDNLQVVHVRGPLLEETHYYPFGLTMMGISSKALAFGEPVNKYKYNGKEEQRKEFADGTGLDWLDYGARFYDPVTSRWMSVDPKGETRPNISPYTYCQNNPIARIDPDGAFDTDFLNSETGEHQYVNDGKNQVLQVTDADYKLLQKEGFNPNSQNYSDILSRGTINTRLFYTVKNVLEGVNYIPYTKNCKEAADKQNNAKVLGADSRIDMLTGSKADFNKTSYFSTGVDYIKGQLTAGSSIEVGAWDNGGIPDNANQLTGHFFNVVGMGFETTKAGIQINYLSYYDNASANSNKGTNLQENRLYFGTLPNSGDIRVLYDNTNLGVRGVNMYIITEIRKNGTK